MLVPTGKRRPGSAPLLVLSCPRLSAGGEPAMLRAATGESIHESFQEGQARMAQELASAAADRIERGLVLPSAYPGETPRLAPLDDRMAHHNVPGVSVAIIDGEEIGWARGYGVLQIGRPERVSTDTLFQAASISKPVTAVAVMRLVEDGRLDLDEDVNRYLKSWRVPPNGAWQPWVTLRQLLSHSAGVTVHGFPGYPLGRPIPRCPAGG